MNDLQTACAHCKVVAKHTDYPDGTRSDYWECESGCGTRIYPETAYEVRKARDKFAGMALMGMLCANAQSHEAMTDKNVDAVIAREAYMSADAMIAERNKP